MRKTRFTEERMVTMLRKDDPAARAGGGQEARRPRADDLRVPQTIWQTQDRLLNRGIGSTCKGRGFCPSCGGRRMADRRSRRSPEIISLFLFESS